MSNDMQEIAQISSPTAGFFNFSNFNEAMQAAQVLSRSNIVPVAYQAYVEKKNYGKGTGQYDENPNAAANCLVALNMASRMGADPLMVMQNLYIIEGRPAWSSQFVIAAVNSCGRFTALRFDITKGDKKEVTYQVAEWENKQKTMVSKTEFIENMSCIAWAIEKSTGDRIESSPITMELAIKEGWYQKSGSKWQTMPEQMLRYRAAAFFGRVYAPEVAMGIYTKDEVEDFTKARDVTPPSETNYQPPATAQGNQAQSKEVVIEYISDEEVSILAKMILCISNPESIANIKKAIPDLTMIPAAHFDRYQNKLKATIDAQAIQDEQESYAQEQSQDEDSLDDYVDVILDDGMQNVVYDSQPMANSQQLEDK